MHVLLLVADDATTPREAAADALAAAWSQAAPHTTYEVRVLPGPRRAAAPSAPGTAAPASGTGVLVAGATLPVGGPAAPGAPAAEPHLAVAAARADLVVVAVDVLDVTTLHEGAVAEAARAAAPHAVPVVVLAGRSETVRREWSGAGLSGVHEVGTEPAGRADRVARVARTWAPAWGSAAGR